jgi:tripartite-type tricarboxylate transporter receptor subunit TctC
MHALRSWRNLLLAGLLAVGVAANANELYPSRPVKVVANMAAGGGTDTIARIFAQRISRELGQPVVVENRAGAAGQIGTEVVASAPADGYTFLFASSSLLSLPYLRTTRYELLKDFEPVGQVGVGGFVLVVNPKLPFKSLTEFMAAVKANPGKYTFGSPGVGSAGHLGLYLLKTKSGADMVHVPFKSSTEVAQALISGQIDCAIDIVPIQKSYIDAQSVRALATTGQARDATLPNVPTFNESNVVPGGYELTFWYAMFAPRGTPAPVVKQAQDAFAAALKDPAMQERVKGFSVVPSQLTAGEFRSSLVGETELWRKIIKDNNITIDN